MGFKPEEMAIVLEEAAQYTDSQRIAHEEKTVITWDGNTEGKPMNGFGDGIFFMVNISPEPIEVTPENFKRLVFARSVGDEYHEIEISLNELFIENTVENGVKMCHINSKDMGMVIICSSDFDSGEGFFLPKGVNVVLIKQDNITQYVKLIETETIHQIDKKFIPGAVLPIIKAKSADDIFLLDETDSIKATNAYKEKIPVILQLETDNETQIFVMTLVVNQNGVAYVFQTGNIQVLMAYQKDQWAGAIFRTETTTET